MAFLLILYFFCRTIGWHGMIWICRQNPTDRWGITSKHFKRWLITRATLCLLQPRMMVQCMSSMEWYIRYEDSLPCFHNQIASLEIPFRENSAWNNWLLQSWLLCRSQKNPTILYIQFYKAAAFSERSLQRVYYIDSLGLFPYNPCCLNGKSTLYRLTLSGESLRQDRFRHAATLERWGSACVVASNTWLD